MKIDDYHTHEALDRCHMLSCILEDHLLSHPFVQANEGVETRLIQAQTLIEEAYQLIGASHSGAPPDA